MLESLIIENEGEVNDTIDAWLLEYQAKEEEKLDAYCYLINKYDEIALEAQRLADRAFSYREKVRQLKYRLKSYLQYRGKDKVDTTRFSLRVVTNGGPVPIKLNEGISVDELPDSYVKISKEPDLQALREALIAGDDSLHAFAYLQPRGTHLRIK